MCQSYVFLKNLSLGLQKNGMSFNNQKRVGIEKETKKHFHLHRMSIFGYHIRAGLQNNNGSRPLWPYYGLP